jgi:hypothetical protein
MKIYGLVGRSGSGKSYQAAGLCRKLGIESILDDGLFISGNRVLAGVSAKRQDTKIRAIKTALFTDDAHKDAVAAKLAETSPASVLVIGTSERMIGKIVGRLGLPEPERLISIESITTEKERKTADKQRNELGKHVIPASPVHLKKEFSGYFMHPLRMIMRMRGGRTRISERSVVRPSFSYMGKYAISSKAVADIAAIVCGGALGVDGVLRVAADKDEAGVTINIAVNLVFGVRAPEVAEKLQKETAEWTEKMTAFNVKAVNVEVKGLREAPGGAAASVQIKQNFAADGNHAAGGLQS